MSSRFAFLDHDGVLAFAHRGGTSRWPENTMPAFQHSVDLGFVYLETDVHLSADGVLFAFHDSNLKERTGYDCAIADLEASELDALLVDGVAPVPRLDELFTTWPHARLNIDAKADAAVLPLIDAIRRHRALDRVCVGSFSDRRIKKCRQELGPELCTSMGPQEALRFHLASHGLADPDRLRAACAQLPMKQLATFADRRHLDFAHEHGMEVHFWTINDPADMTTLVDLGADGIMTDRPRLLRDVLIDRRVWTRQGAST